MCIYSYELENYKKLYDLVPVSILALQWAKELFSLESPIFRVQILGFTGKFYKKGARPKITDLRSVKLFSRTTTSVKFLYILGLSLKNFKTTYLAQLESILPRSIRNMYKYCQTVVTKGKRYYKHIVLISDCFGVIVYAVFVTHCVPYQCAWHSSCARAPHQLCCNFARISGNRPGAVNRFARAHFCIRVNRLSGACKLTTGSVTVE